MDGEDRRSRETYISPPDDVICPYRQKIATSQLTHMDEANGWRRGAEGKTIIVIINMQVSSGSGCYTYLKFNNLFKWATSSCAAASYGRGSDGRKNAGSVLFCKFRTVCVSIESTKMDMQSQSRHPHIGHWRIRQGKGNLEEKIVVLNDVFYLCHLVSESNDVSLWGDMLDQDLDLDSAVID